MASYSEKIGNFLNRHRRKFIFVGVFCGGVYGVAKYAEWKVKDWMEIEREKSISEKQKLDHFQNTEMQCFLIVRAVLLSINKEISNNFNVSEIISQIKSENDQAAKLNLWKELKIVVFTKLISKALLTSYCVVIISTQLNQVAAKGFSALETGDAFISEELQKWYLALCHDFVLQNFGKEILPTINKLSLELVDSMPLQCPMTPGNIENVLKSYEQRIFEKLSNKKVPKMSSFNDLMFPSVNDISFKNFKGETTTQFLKEMWDILDSNDFADVMKENLTMSLTNLADLTVCNIWPSQVKEIDASHKDIVPHTSIPLAKLLPVLNKEIDSINSDMFLKRMLSEPSLCDFKANVFEAFIQ